MGSECDLKGEQLQMKRCHSVTLACCDVLIVDCFLSPLCIRWQGGMGKTAFQLQQTLGSLDNLSPVYLKAYRVSKQNGGHVVSEQSGSLTTHATCAGVTCMISAQGINLALYPRKHEFNILIQRG